MTTQRQVQETIARCVSSLVYYVNDRKSLEATRMVEYEIDRIAHWVTNEGLDERADLVIRRPVVKELTDRYGRTAALQLAARFLRPLGRERREPALVGSEMAG